MKSLKIKSGWLPESGLRMDASYHLGDGPISKVKLKKSPFKMTTLEAASDDIFKGNIFKRCYVNSPEKGYPFLSPSDMMKADINGGKYVSKKYTDTANLLLKKGWILVSRSGTLGNVVYTNDEFEGMVGSDDLIRILPNNKNVLGGYLYAYLASKYGYALLTQSSYGGVVKHIEPHHIKELPIPIFPDEKQREIHNLILEASELRVEANRLLNEAMLLFDKENDLKFDKNILDQSENALKIGFIVKKSDLFKTTLKARNFSERAAKIIEKWNQRNGVILNEYLEVPFQMGARASFKRITSLNFKGSDLISQGDIHKQNPKEFKQVKVKKIREEDTAQRSSVIMPCAGTLGENEIFTRPLLVRNNFEGKLLSEVIGTFKCKNEIDAAYLYIALSTKAGFRVLRAMVYGTNLLYPNWELLKNIKVPMKNELIKERIAIKVLEAFDKRGDADLKENQAINLIEKEIESWQE